MRSIVLRLWCSLWIFALSGCVNSPGPRTPTTQISSSTSPTVATTTAPGRGTPSTPSARRVATATPPLPLPDFAFIFEANHCRDINRLDTFEGTYFWYAENQNLSSTTKLVLSRQDLTSIYRKMAEIDLFNYPELPSRSSLYAWPYTHYRLKVRNGGQVKEIYWTLTPSTQLTRQETAFYQLAQAIQQIIDTRAEVRRKGAGCT